nr:hypothetical protein [Tanacetum cinerariifolium]
MSDASSAVTYTSVYTDSKPWRYYEEDSAETGPLRVIVYGYDGLPIQPIAPPSPDYIPGPEHPPSLDYETLIFDARPALITDFFHGLGSPFMDHSKAIDEMSKERFPQFLKVEMSLGCSLRLLVIALPTKKQECLMRTSSWGRIPPFSTFAPKGVAKHPRVLARNLESSEDSHDIFVPYVQKAYSTHNVLSSLHYPSLKNKPDSLSLEDLANIYDVYALHLDVVGNMLTNESRIVSKDYSKLKDDFISLRSKNELHEHEMSKHEGSLSKAKKNQDVEGYQKKLFEDLDRLHPFGEEVEHLGKRDFLPLAIRKLFSSEHFNCALGDLQQKTITFGRSQALNEVHGLGSSWDFKDVKDYNPYAEKIFDEAAEGFYKLEFPYISVLVEKVGQSPELLAAMDPLTI